MPTDRIRDAINAVNSVLAEHPELGRIEPHAIAFLESGLRFTVADSEASVVRTDMSPAVGGEGSGPTPGWLMVASVAACLGTTIAMRAAQIGIELEKVEVALDSESDARGLLGTIDGVFAGSLAGRLVVRLKAPGATDQELHDLVEWAEVHSPVSATLREPPKVELSVEVDHAD